MSSLSKVFLMAGLFSVPLFVANASDGGSVGPTLSPTKMVKLMGGNTGSLYYATTTA